MGLGSMVVLDNSAILGAPRLPVRALALVGAIILGAVLLLLAALLLAGFGENGYRLGSMLAWRYAALIFFAVLVTGPLCRIAARALPSASMPEAPTRALVWGFAGSQGIYLLSVFGPHAIALSAGARLMVFLGGGVALAMALASLPLPGEGRWARGANRVRRAILEGAAAYFWLCYSVMALARISGPHRPDLWYGASLCLMVAGLLARYADTWFAHRDARKAAR